MIQKERLIKLLSQLIAFNSENPNSDEYAIGCFVHRYLQKLGINSRIYEFKKRRLNVVANIGPSLAERSLLITPHLDTVPAGKNWKTNPFQAVIKGNKIYGLGASDCKGNLAVALEVIRSLVEEKIPLQYNLVFAATANEESGSEFGLKTLLEKAIIRTTEAIVLDSDNFKIVITQKGLLHIKISVWGKRAHGAYPWLGMNAILIMKNILNEICNKKIPYTPNPFLRAPTINIGTIHGGDKVNIVAPFCEAELDIRFLPGQKPEDYLTVIKKICKRYAKKFSIEVEGVQKPYAISINHPLVKGLKKAAKFVGVPSYCTGSEGATVITFFQQYNISAIATGYGAEGSAHCVNEYAKINDLYQGAKILKNFLSSWH
ncbi:MAG: M20 family metallopeptidase [Candidatus Omnitrophica bacterium]|nr:M20 family metallopeptidase [Candidatus Omnitrophota bacterium]